MKIIPILAVSATVLISCQKEKPSEKITNDAPVETVTETAPAQAAEATPALIQNGTPTANTQSVAPGMNPAHGQPGHRCDIAVGAPLTGNPPAAKTTVTPTQTTTTQGNNQFQVTPGSATVTKTVIPNSNPTVTTTPTPIVQTTEPGMQGKPNPAHGQPGHRCDVPTGQPLP